MPPIAPVFRNHSHSNPLPSLLLPQTAEATSEATSEPKTDHEPALLKAASPSTQDYITLTISHPHRTYATVVLLGDSSPSSSSSPYSSPSPPPFSTRQSKQSAAGEISSSPNVGIVIGCLTGLALLIGVVYVWILRAKQRKRGRGKKTKKGEKKEKTETTEKVEKAEKPKKKKAKKKKRRRKKGGSVKSSQGAASPAAPAEAAPAADAAAA